MKVAIKYKLVAIAAAALAAFMSLTVPAHAEELTGTLKKVHDDGLITLGVREASIPFSYSTGDQTVGYSQSIALAIVEEIRKTLAMPNLKVREVT
ncbi:MAG: amino acid ABC transporter substrate-binding protein, partial [Paraburkholderia hospita]